VWTIIRICGKQFVIQNAWGDMTRIVCRQVCFVSLLSYIPVQVKRRVCLQMHCAFLFISLHSDVTRFVRDVFIDGLYELNVGITQSNDHR
jgi:hypothetical protein